jgi:hypothetical protein
MCEHCKTRFTVHSASELKGYLVGWGTFMAIDELVKGWLTKGYLTNLIYLEYLSEKKDKL